MCHAALEIELNENVNFIVGRNGSGKSAILTALTVGLGARANVTSRGASVKEFIKKGEASATIEITLSNEGDGEYKHDIYGNVIIVTRLIGPTYSAYKIKNWKGEIISTKRDELENIVTSMNIQIDNPISVLNQDVSRTFLINSKPEEKYNLFMKATLLDMIENNYIEALKICEEENEKLDQYYETMSQIKSEIEKLKDNISKVESMDESRAELTNLENELPWAIVSEEEIKLNKIQQTLNTHEANLKELQATESSVGSVNEKIDSKIKEIEEKIQRAGQEREDIEQTYISVQAKHTAAKEAYFSKQREWRSVENQVKRFEDDIGLLMAEIQKLENCNDEQYNQRKVMEETLSKLDEKLDELEASMRTKQTELMHLEADNMRLLQEKQSVKIELDNHAACIRKLERNLNGFKQTDNALSVYGPNIPRLLRRIEEECKKGRFKEKPRGPIGANIKLKNKEWIPAVESYLGRHTLNTFCVDNSQDAKLLTSIMKEIFHNEKLPQIITSKFYHRIHDVSRHCTQSSTYSNLLDAMVIDDPIVANCLIDQREVECILLIPTNQEACQIMSNATKVPKNCKRAFTQQGDTYFPDPNYRTYGGRCERPKLLQVSTKEAMQTLKEELELAEGVSRETRTAYIAICEKEERTKSALTNVNANVKKLKDLQRRYKEQIDNLKDKLEMNNGTSTDVFRNEITELEKKMVQQKVKEEVLAAKVQELQNNVKSLEDDVKRYRNLINDASIVIEPLNEQIAELTQEKNSHRFETQRSARKLQVVQQAVQTTMAKFAIQERATRAAINDAEKKCPRIDTTKTKKRIKDLMADLRNKICEIEHQYGSVDDLKKHLQEKEEKYGSNIEFMTKLKESCEKHIERVKRRHAVYEELRQLYGVHIQKSFKDVLALRHYKGDMMIDHTNKVLNLNVSARADNSSNKDNRSLSGGERSYSTVAFILAIWECIKLPFYFLDEFDVFMDKVNRRVIMDILLDHTKTHSESQFCFLTPLDTSSISTEDYLTIHQLQPPERRGLSQ
ncbi:PREDICTED: structural maintenance of chromosomes protein 6 isoform X2 [Dinoponera quadriceps]|nr:PREDICTED: structural maintenance of chromosomes protein 6 isoform X2 [Dinoponera quadriceps]